MLTHLGQALPALGLWGVDHGGGEIRIESSQGVQRGHGELEACEDALSDLAPRALELL